MDWIKDPGTLSAIGSLGAVVIAVFALYLSNRGESAKRLREQREELRGVLERLIGLREEQAELVKEREESVRAAASVWQHTKRSIYLEAAESLALQLLPDLTAAELSVIALENWYDSDWVEARAWYERADARSEHTSPTKRAEILRSLASTYYISDGTLLDPETGTQVYQRCIAAIDGRTDNYSLYTRARCYQSWAYSALTVQHLEQSSELHRRAWEEWQRIPSSQAVAWLAEVRSLAFNYGHLGSAWFNTSDYERGRTTYGEAIAITEALSSRYGSTGDYTIDARALVLQWWGQSEVTAGDPERGRQLLDAAKETFATLSDEFVWRGFRLSELELARARAAPPPPEAPVGDPRRASGAEDITPVR